jgi:methylated-DNA-protein-cysteine methyltransferase related protein
MTFQNNQSLHYFERVYALVQKIPMGKVTTYGILAKALGTRDARRIGHALHANPDNGKTPCHRVVFSDGRLAPGFAFGGPDEQKRLLQSEHVVFVDKNHVDLKTCFYTL